jgi:hypothetical protein
MNMILIQNLRGQKIISVHVQIHTNVLYINIFIYTHMDLSMYRNMIQIHFFSGPED